jgi:N-acetylglucosamine-6-sulfatase
VSGRLRSKVVALTILLCLVFVPATSTTQHEGKAATRPNVLFILTDDLDARTAHRMPKLERLVAERGITFSEAFVTTPQCCPSRASILTGKYTHNHEVYQNGPPEGSAIKFHSSGEERDTVATWLNEQGYETIMIGKYLNYYDGTYVPPGWDEWHGQIGRNNDHEYNHNGAIRHYDPDRYHDTDLFSDWAAYHIRRSATDERPFFMYLAINAPHGPDDGAPRDEEKFPSAKLPRSPSFNENVSDKPAWIRSLPPLDDADIEMLTERYRDRLRSLVSVDQMIKRLIVELEESGQLENTYIVFTSDNGFHLGEHLPNYGKATAYEEDIHVPLYVRGPGVPAGRTMSHKVLNIDLAPTFAELVGARASADVDGRSFVPLLSRTPPQSDSWRRSFLIEFFQYHQYAALRTGKYSYIEYDEGSRELYDLETDPYQLESLHDSPEHQELMKRLHTRLERLKACSGQESCEAAENEAPRESVGGV